MLQTRPVILLEIRGPGIALDLHPRVTIVSGLDAATRGELVDGLGPLLSGDKVALAATAEVNGNRLTLPEDAPPGIGGEAAALVVLRATDLPGARPSTGTTGEGREEALRAAERAATAAVAAAESALADAEAASGRAEAELHSAEREAAQGRVGDADAAGALDSAGRRLQLAQEEAANARRALADASGAADRERDEQATSAAGQAAKADRVSELTALLSELESRRSALVTALVEVGEPIDASPVEAALTRLDEAERASEEGTARARALAARWAELRRLEAETPGPVDPPEWLLTPALASRDDARDAVAAAEAGGRGTGFEPAKVEELERAHREVLDAEQRVMRKATRQARRRLAQAQEAEAKALEGLGAASYGDYLRRIVPLLEDDRPVDERLAQARARLSDAEAVLEELYSGNASPEWLALRDELNALRNEVAQVLGVLPADDEIEGALESYRRAEADEARARLRDALTQAGVVVSDDADPREAARAWLETAPTVAARRGELEAELATVAARLTATETELAEHRADAFFGTPDARADVTTPQEALDALGRTAAEAESAADEARAAVASARRRIEEDQAGAAAHEDAVAAGVALARDAWEDARRRLAAAEEGLAAARGAAADAADAADRARAVARAGPGPLDLAGVRPLEVEVYVLARLAALRSAGGAGPLPLVVDADVLALPAPATERLLALLARSSGAVQVVVLDESAAVQRWARSLGPDGAAVREASGTAA